VTEITPTRAETLPNFFTLHAQPRRNGFFGLSQLESFINQNVEPYLRAPSKPTLIFDFSTVTVWDIAALLWLTPALHHYKRNLGLSYLLRLPSPSPSIPEEQRAALERSADYLRRWRFDRALRTIDADVPNLLVPDQQDYFSPPEPRRFYLPKRQADESGLLSSLISRRLAEIRELSDPAFTGSAPISPDRISQCVRQFQAERIGDILTSQCGIETRKADLFSDHLLTEALLNVKEHPNATIGMVAISLMGATRELILTVVDNGESIPATIFERYATDARQSTSGAPQPTSTPYETLTLRQRADVAHHATKPGVTRKTGLDAATAGMGLTYIRDDCVGTFRGNLTIVTDSIKLTYQKNAQDDPAFSEWRHSWQGNLLRIAIPLTHAE